MFMPPSRLVRHSLQDDRPYYHQPIGVTMPVVAETRRAPLRIVRNASYTMANPDPVVQREAGGALLGDGYVPIAL